MNPLDQARELNDILQPLMLTSDRNVRSEVAQLLTITMNADTEFPPEPETIEEIRERTEALLKGIKHPKRLDI